MGTRRIKQSKKELQQKAKVTLEAPLFSKEWLEEHSRKILIISILIVFTLGCLWGVDAYGKYKETRAREQYARILQHWPPSGTENPESWKKLGSEIETYLQQYPRTASAVDAYLSLVHIYFQTQDYEIALKWAEKALRETSKRPDLKFLALYQTALIYQVLGRTDEAIKAWTSLKGEGPEQLRRETAWNLALLYAKQNDLAKAIDHYEEAIKSSGLYPSSAMLQEQMQAVKSRAGWVDPAKAPTPAATTTN